MAWKRSSLNIFSLIRSLFAENEDFECRACSLPESWCCPTGRGEGQPMCKERMLDWFATASFVVCDLLDPSTMVPQKAVEVIGNRLQDQYTRWQPKVLTSSNHLMPFSKIYSNLPFRNDVLFRSLV